jgi:hypothetical protein
MENAPRGVWMTPPTTYRRKTSTRPSPGRSAPSTTHSRPPRSPEPAPRAIRTMRTSVAMAAAARSQRDGARQSVQQLLQYTVLDKARALSLFSFPCLFFHFRVCGSSGVVYHHNCMGGGKYKSFIGLCVVYSMRSTIPPTPEPICAPLPTGISPYCVPW